MKRPSDTVLSALFHCVTGVAQKTIDGNIPQSSQHNIESIVVVRGTLKKGRDTQMTPAPYITPELMLFTIMRLAECSGKQATNRLKTIVAAFAEKMKPISAIKERAKAEGREPNAQEKRDIDSLTEQTFGMDKDEILTNFRSIFEVEAAHVPGRITANVTVEEIDGEVQTQIKAMLAGNRF